MAGVCIELDCHSLTVDGPRCEQHRLERQRATKSMSARPWYGGTWSAFARAVLATHVHSNGPICAGWADQEPHIVDPGDLTLDHNMPRSMSRDPNDYTPRCRSCNASKGDTVTAG